MFLLSLTSAAYHDHKHHGQEEMLMRRRRDELRPHNDRRRRRLRRLIPNGNRVAYDPANEGCGRYCGIIDGDSRNLARK